MTTRRALASAAAVLACGALATAFSGTAGLARIADEIERGRGVVDAVTVARWIMEDAERVALLDLHDSTGAAPFRLPGAVPVRIADITVLSLPADTRAVFFGDDPIEAAQAWVLLRARGHDNAWYLRGGVHEWVARVLEPRLAVDATPQEIAAYEEAVPLSRYFGGQPRRDVPREEVPTGHWSSQPRATSQEPDDFVDRVRRRGC